MPWITDYKNCLKKMCKQDLENELYDTNLRLMTEEGSNEQRKLRIRKVNVLNCLLHVKK